MKVRPLNKLAKSWRRAPDFPRTRYPGPYTCSCPPGGVTPFKPITCPAERTQLLPSRPFGQFDLEAKVFDQAAACSFLQAFFHNVFWQLRFRTLQVNMNDSFHGVVSLSQTTNHESLAMFIWPLPFQSRSSSLYSFARRAGMFQPPLRPRGSGHLARPSTVMA